MGASKIQEGVGRFNVNVNMIDFSKIPIWWPLCPGYDCPRSGECLRHQAFCQAPEDVTQWVCILPQASVGGTRGCFQSGDKVRMARGFRALVSKMSSRDMRHNVRMSLTRYFGSKGSYYRYKDGERLMNPKQQQEVHDIFRRYGFEDDIVFDEYIETYDYTALPENVPTAGTKVPT